jgi:hypothetical protein
MNPDSSKINCRLISISDSNTSLVRTTINHETYILAVTWKSQIAVSKANYKKYVDSAFFNTGNWELWVTVVPELMEKMEKERYNDLNLRLKQLLGLPPNSSYDYFIEFWVKPDDLFRPCPDREITDKKCELCCPVDVDSTDLVWFDECKKERYANPELFHRYPWSQLGYTYDWDPDVPSHIGLSEFVVKKNSKVKIRGVYPTLEYLKNRSRTD